MTVNNVANGVKDAQGTIIITGANGSLGFGFAKNLLRNYSGYFVILAVRNTSNNDPNTLELRRIASGFSDANVSIEAVDLASLASVRSFADSINSRVANGTIPRISAIVCNAFIWSLVGQKKSGDGFELGFQTSHLSHFLLVLKLIDSMDKRASRIVFLGSVQIQTPTTSQNPLGTALPTDLNELVTSPPEKKGEEQIRGFQRYAWSKMANVMCMEMLNRKLLGDPSTKNITALAMNPGNMPTSRCFQYAPMSFKLIIWVAGHLILPMAKYFTNAFRTTDAAGADLVSMAVGPAGKGARGYFLGVKPAEAVPETRDTAKQEKLWDACGRWVQLQPNETVLS